MKLSSHIVKEATFTQTTKSHTLPILATSSFDFKDMEEGMDIFSGNKCGHVYSRYGNPTIEAVARKIVSLETFGLDIPDAIGFMTSSGMSAISTLLYALLKPNDTILTQPNLYGGTTEFLQKFLKKMGVHILWCDFNNRNEVEKILKEQKIKVIYCETPSNPSLDCVDLEWIGNLANSYNVLSIVDNTFCTPYIQQPFEYGIDFIIHSSTKFLNGHGTGISGVIISRSNQYYDLLWDALKLIGTNCNPTDAFYVSIGLKTLALRMQQHSRNALKLGQFLSEQSKITKVNYPFLKNNPFYNIARKQMRLGGGMLSFEIDAPLEIIVDAMKAITFCSMAPTLGDVDTLILHPASMSHRNMARKERYQNGITDGLVRISVGIEDVEDIINDIQKVLKKI